MDILLKNIYHLKDQTGKKIGDFEDEIGVSRGYFSRKKNKREDAIPLDVAMKIADTLKVSLEVLIYVDLSEIDDDNLFALNFINFLVKKTEKKEYVWKTIDTYTIQRYLSGEWVPDPDMHMLQNASREDEDLSHTSKVYKSHFVESFLSFGDMGDYNKEPRPWFQLELDENNKLLLTHMYHNLYGGDYYYSVMELYKYSNDSYGNEDASIPKRIRYGKKVTPLGCTANKGREMERVMELLYETVYKHRHDTVIDAGEKSYIENIMKNG